MIEESQLRCLYCLVVVGKLVDSVMESSCLIREKLDKHDIIYLVCNEYTFIFFHQPELARLRKKMLSGKSILQDHIVWAIHIYLLPGFHFVIMLSWFATRTACCCLLSCFVLSFFWFVLWSNIIDNIPMMLLGSLGFVNVVQVSKDNGGKSKAPS